MAAQNWRLRAMLRRMTERRKTARKMAGGMMWVMGLYSDGLCEDFVGTISGLNRGEELIKGKFRKSNLMYWNVPFMACCELFRIFFSDSSLEIIYSAY